MSLGRRGGLKGGAARAQNLSAERRSAIARKAATTRWEQQKRDQQTESLAHAVSLHDMHYKFARVHQSLRTTPAMASGVADHKWTLHEIAALLDSDLPTSNRGAPGPGPVHCEPG